MNVYKDMGKYINTYKYMLISICIQILQMNKVRHTNFQKVYECRLIFMFQLWLKWREFIAKTQVHNTMIYEAQNSFSCGYIMISSIFLIFPITMVFLIYYN